KTESYVPIGSPSRLLVEFRNMDSLSFRIYKVTAKDKVAFNEFRLLSEKLRFINRLTAHSSWQTVLRNEFDYQQHASEVVIPALPQGDFLIVATEKNGEIDDDAILGYSFVQITNLALIQSEENGEHRYQVVNRNNGSAIPNAKLEFFNR